MKFWLWCEKINFWIFTSYIRSRDNIEADFESGHLEQETEYSLSWLSFSDISSRLGEPAIDLFATRVNAKCKDFVSWLKDPESIAVDAFTLDWKKYFFYAFPPFIVILRVLRKIIDDSAEGIVVKPLWPAQPWYPRFYSMMISEPIYFKPSPKLLISLDKQPHPLWKKITLIAGVLSGKHFAEKGYQIKHLMS